MNTEHNKAVVRRFYEALDANNAEALAELVTADWENVDPALPPLRGPEGARALVASLKTAFPDYATTINHLMAEGDRVASYMTHTGTHAGPFNGLPATGKQATITASAIFTLRDGKISQNKVIFDAVGLLRQLGVIPA